MTRAKFCFAISFLATLLFKATAAEAGTVRAVSKEKAMVAVDLAPGEKPSRNAKVCFYSTAHKKIACGTAVKLKGTILIVKVDKRALGKISKGLTANLEGGGGGDNQDAGLGGPDAAGADVGEKGAGGGGRGKNSKKPPLRVSFGWDFALSLPASYNEVSYQAPQASPPATLWQTSKTVSSGLLPPSYIVYSGEIGIPVGAKAVNVGFRYQIFQANLVTSDYNAQSLEPYVSTEVKGSAVGFWADYQYYRNPISSMFTLNLTGGLDYDTTSVTVSALQLTDGTAGSTPVASGSGKLTLISARAGARLDALVLPPVGISLGATALIPLLTMANSFSSSFGDGQDRGVGNPQADLKSAVGLKKKSFGLEVTLSAFVTF